MFFMWSLTEALDLYLCWFHDLCHCRIKLLSNYVNEQVFLIKWNLNRGSQLLLETAVCEDNLHSFYMIMYINFLFNMYSSIFNEHLHRTTIITDCSPSAVHNFTAPSTPVSSGKVLSRWCFISTTFSDSSILRVFVFCTPLLHYIPTFFRHFYRDHCSIFHA